MKLVRYGPAGREKPGMIDAEGRLRDLSRKVKDIDGEALAPASLAKLAKLDPAKLPLVKGRPRLGPCVATPPKFVAIGLNFIDHAKETNSPIPEHPIVFFKAETSIAGGVDEALRLVSSDEPVTVALVIPPIAVVMTLIATAAPWLTPSVTAVEIAVSFELATTAMP